MKVVIPLAGKGTRLRPHTHIHPKPMLKIAGKPVIDYVMEDLERLGGIDQVIYITGHLKDKVEEYVRAKYPFEAAFVEQKEQRGTADAVALARPYIDEPVMIIFVDTIFDADFSVVKRIDADGIIWVKEVEDYQRFGVVVTDKDGNMTTLVDPVYIEDNVTLKGSKIGPNVSVSAGSTIEDSELKDTIVGAKSQVRRSTLANSLIGDEAIVEGIRGEITISDHS